MSALIQTQIKSLLLVNQGKVRDIYELDDQHLLMISTDRVSAFDVILPNGIPGKGKLLTQIARFWFKQFEDLIPNHLVENYPLASKLTPEEIAQIDGRYMVVRRFKTLPIEAIVRGYIIGSGWKDYQKTGAICGHPLPPELLLAEQLPKPIFTPSTKAAVGDHDENIDFERTKFLLGDDLAKQVRDISLAIYNRAATYARGKGMIIADTKFEFGVDDRGRLYLIDEVLTPDSSRFWDMADYAVNQSPPSFDKQIVRDYLESLDWDKTPPGPMLPDAIVEKTLAKYQEARDRLLG